MLSCMRGWQWWWWATWLLLIGIFFTLEFALHVLCACCCAKQYSITDTYTHCTHKLPILSACIHRAAKSSGHLLWMHLCSCSFSLKPYLVAKVALIQEADVWQTEPATVVQRVRACHNGVCQTTCIKKYTSWKKKQRNIAVYVLQDTLTPSLHHVKRYTIAKLMVNTTLQALLPFCLAIHWAVVDLRDVSTQWQLAMQRWVLQSKAEQCTKTTEKQNKMINPDQHLENDCRKDLVRASLHNSHTQKQTNKNSTRITTAMPSKPRQSNPVPSTENHV